LRHLYISREILAMILNTIHNVRFYLRFMEDMRRSIQSGEFDRFKKAFLETMAVDGLEEGAVDITEG
jgi:queuine tRNA-ribosyltransferase